MLPEFSSPSLSLPVPSVAGFILSLILLPPYIRWLKAKQLGQYIREEGPASHAIKAATPTMGGLVFMPVAALCAGLWLHWAGALVVKPLLVLGIALLCGGLGLVDDLAKFRRKANAGLSARARLLIELALGLVLGAALLAGCGEPYAFVPASIGSAFGLGGELSSLGLPLLPFLTLSAFLVAATTNAVNLHDGMDGLAAGTGAQVLAAMAAVLLATGQWPLAAVAASGAGSLAAFLVFNRYPASIFMGDTGSLFVGGLMASLAIAGGIEIWFVPLAVIYILETVSVMMQVVYFKLTKQYTPAKPMSRPALVWLKLTKRLPGEGKRLFRMAPLHHHFEAIALEKGHKEWQVVACFWIVQLLLCVLVLVVLPA
ncbi:MAG TPA: phospho-N-acetylmuramoyl-pentapeptide-transferase [Candidatus Obscuribacterales bacterium]